METLEKKAKKQDGIGTALDLLFVPTSGIRAIRTLKKNLGHHHYHWTDYIPISAGELSRAYLYGSLISFVYNSFKG